MPDLAPLKKFDHIVVLMLENRSFDNLLGWLYDPENEPPYDVVPPNFEGLSGKKLSNPGLDGKPVPAGKTTDPRSPLPNPGEPFQEVFSQMYNVPMTSLGQVLSSLPDPQAVPNMQGFITNYAIQKNQTDPTKIMLSLTPKTVPVLSALAHNYAVCDHWFASIPTQTFCNRSFVHAGTSSGFVNNDGPGHCFINNTTTIFDLLEDAKKSWKIYTGSWLLESFTLLTQRHVWKYLRTPHFAHFKEFLAAAGQKGGLPSYSFIEPIYFDSLIWGPQNDAHPESNRYEFYGPSSLHHAEALVWRLYDAIRNGPNWEKTLLVVLFDEHGGCYDHVPPPSLRECPVAVAPDDNLIDPNTHGGSGFKFDRLGPRVPAIIVSAYTPPQTRLNAVFEHTSVLSTVVECFDLPEKQLGRRQTVAKDLSDAVKLPAARSDRPLVPKPESSVLQDVRAELHAIVHSKLFGAHSKEISDLQRTILHGAALMTQSDELHTRIDGLETELQADLLLMEHTAKLMKARFFGPAAKP